MERYIICDVRLNDIGLLYLNISKRNTEYIRSMKKRKKYKVLLETRICAAEMAVRYAALAEKYMCVIVIR